MMTMFRAHGTPRVPVILVLLALTAAGCQPTVRVRGQAAQPAGGLVEAPAPAALVPASPRPSAERGRKVFEKACFPCHGNEGLGDGPAAKSLTAPQKNPMTDFFGMFGMKLQGEKLPSRPANFHNQVAMRLNAPFTMVETISLGRPHTAMPSFGPKIAYGATKGFPSLSLPEIWDVMFYEWTFATTPKVIDLGRSIYRERAVDVGGRAATCAVCHGTAGDGRGGALSEEMARRVWGWKQQASAGIFTNVNLLAQRKPSELFQGILNGRGQMPAYRGKLTEDEIWALVDYLWTFVYDYRPPRGQEPPAGQR
jgi:mono/diheme cytochrome c family protein